MTRYYAMSCYAILCYGHAYGSSVSMLLPFMSPSCSLSKLTEGGYQVNFEACGLFDHIQNRISFFKHLSRPHLEQQESTFCKGGCSGNRV